MSELQIALAGLALIASLGFLTWVASVVQRDVSLVDRTWSVFITGEVFTRLRRPSISTLASARCLMISNDDGAVRCFNLLTQFSGQDICGMTLGYINQVFAGEKRILWNFIHRIFG